MARQSVPPTVTTPALSPAPPQSQEAGASGVLQQPQAATQRAIDSTTGLQSPISAHHQKHKHSKPKVHTNPFVHFHGTRSSCVRHGRKSGSGKPKPSGYKATKDMYERSRSGAYIPVGPACIRQMEATSPWAVATSTTRCTELTCLTAEASKDDEDACPDCVAELGIKKREMGKTVSEWGDSAFPDLKAPAALSDPLVSKSTAEKEPFPAFAPTRLSTLNVDPHPYREEYWGSTAVEPPDSESDDDLPTASCPSMKSAPSSANNAASLDHGATDTRKRSRSVRFDDYSEEVYDDTDAGHLIISRDLGDDLDAVILERGGKVERVITNARDRNSTSELIAKISRELAEISRAISSNNLNNRRHAILDEDEDGGRTAAVDRTSDSAAGSSSRQSSVPELLALINDAATNLEPGLIRRPTWERVPGGQTWLDQTSANDVAAEFNHSFTPFDEPETHREANQVPLASASERIVSRQRLDEDYRILKEHILANTQHEQDLSLLKYQRRPHRPQSTTPLTTSTCYASRPSSSPTQNLGSPDIPITVSAGEATLPSHLLHARDFLAPIPSVSPLPLG